jgi:hypothetical protein
MIVGLLIHPISNVSPSLYLSSALSWAVLFRYNRNPLVNTIFCHTIARWLVLRIMKVADRKLAALLGTGAETAVLLPVTY